MPETVAEQAVCPKCDAEIRSGSVFCYNCGGRVVPEEEVQPAAVEETTVEKSTRPAPGMRSASDIRRRERPASRPVRQFKWEPQGDKFDTQLIITTAIILAFSVIVIILALYLR